MLLLHRYDLWLDSKDVAIGVNSIQGFVLVGALLASFAFALRMGSRLTLSSFHLMRDAQEREQLTHLYLALVHDEKQTDDTKLLVYQVLFSRTDSGLLTNLSLIHI